MNHVTNFDLIHFHFVVTPLLPCVVWLIIVFIKLLKRKIKPCNNTTTCADAVAFFCDHHCGKTLPKRPCECSALLKAARNKGKWFAMDAHPQVALYLCCAIIFQCDKVITMLQMGGLFLMATAKGDIFFVHAITEKTNSLVPPGFIETCLVHINRKEI